MVVELQSLIDLRRNAEKSAEHALALAVAALEREEKQQERFQIQCQEASASLDRERKRLGAADPATGAQAMARASYLARLREVALRLRQVASTHRAGPLATAANVEAAARSALVEAHAARAALEKLQERAHAEERRLAERRRDDGG